jgi:protein O-mannose beta-1,4-N-acetylglucosaminyltransferase
MHTVHDDFIGLYLLHRLFAPNTDPDPSFTFSQDNNIFFADSWPNLRYDYIFQLLTSNPIQFREVFRTDHTDTLPICFRDAVIGNSKIGSWYTYGFLEPQGPIPNKTVSGLLIREISSYIIKRFHLPLWNENSIRGILRELKEVIESRKGKKREPLFRSISDHHFITIFSRKIDRLITNEGDLAEKLERIYGLEVRYVRIEDMHLREQITILKNTVIAVGMHGSALILSMFLPPGALLVELYPYRVPAENYTPYRTLCQLPGMRLAYKAWVNTHPENNYPHPEKPAAGGGLRHLPKEKQDEIENGTTVPPHLCCADPTWLYRIYQDTKVEIEEILNLVDDGISEGFDLVNSDPGEYVYIRPASVENVYCRVANSTERENHLDLYISWTAPWNGVKPDFYGLWMHQAYKEFVSNSTDYVFESCIPDMEYDIWVRPYTIDRLSGENFKGAYSDKFTCKCSHDAKAIKKKREEEEL